MWHGKSAVFHQVWVIPQQLITSGGAWISIFVAIAEFDGHKQKYMSVQHVPAMLNHSYKVISLDGGIAMDPVEVKYDAGVRTVTVDMFKDLTENYQLKTLTPQ